MRVPGRRPVTVLRRVRRADPQDPAKWARDSRGNAVYDEQRLTVNGCSVQPGAGLEDNDNGRPELSALTTIYAPPSWPGGVIDAVEIDGVRHEIEGRPQRWPHPRLAHVVVTVREVSGG